MCRLSTSPPPSGVLGGLTRFDEWNTGWKWVRVHLALSLPFKKYILSLTHSLTHWLTHWLTHPPTRNRGERGWGDVWTNCKSEHLVQRDSSFQNIVSEFLAAQQHALDCISSLEKERQQAMSRMVTLEEEVASHKAHIVTLKKELTAACRRQMSEDGLSDNGGGNHGGPAVRIHWVFLSLALFGARHRDIGLLNVSRKHLCFHMCKFFLQFVLAIAHFLNKLLEGCPAVQRWLQVPDIFASNLIPFLSWGGWAGDERAWGRCCFCECYNTCNGGMVCSVCCFRRMLFLWGTLACVVSPKVPGMNSCRCRKCYWFWRQKRALHKLYRTPFILPL